MFTSCRKADVSETLKTEKKDKVIENARTGSSQWTYGEPKCYDKWGIPHWGKNYPRIESKILIENNKHILRIICFFNKNDKENVLQHLKQKGGVKINQFAPKSNPYAPCSPCHRTGMSGVACNCGDHEEVVITAQKKTLGGISVCTQYSLENLEIVPDLEYNVRIIILQE